MRTRPLFICFAAAALAIGRGVPARRVGAAEPPARPVDFVKDVRPIFAKACVSCHGPEKHKSDYRLDSRQAALRGGSIGGAIVPRHSADSKLIGYVSGLDEDTVMPPQGERLTPAQVDVLRAWIDQGAPWPDDAASGQGGVAAAWSLRPLARPPVPRGAGADGSWARGEIDAFILAKLRQNGLAPSPPADKRALIRRVTFDLIGLPPSPEEIRAFVADPSPPAYERLVDRLLASPRYGERWARHWLDVVHYADSHGFGMDRPRPNAWPYRDYVIQSLNDDKPYARFAQEQLAGDVLFPGDPRATVALGFIAAGPWNQSPLAEQMDDVDCKKIAQLLDRDDMVATAMNTFVSTTVQCARCHDHKFDPVPQREYYDLQAVFAGVDRVDRPFDADPALAARRRQLGLRRAELAAGRGAPADDPAVRAAVEAWETDQAAARDAWVVLEPAHFASTGGATVTPLPDRSLLFAGARPANDTYTVAARARAPQITAVRLEILTDASLPHRGPGRQDNGNITLSEFKVFAAPVGESAPTTRAATPAATRAAATKLLAAPIRSATADFDQPGWTAALSLDGKPATGWGIYPQVGTPHQVVYELKEPIKADAGVTLVFVLEQLHGEGHLIGRPRFSVSPRSNPSGAGPGPVPPTVAAALAVPADRRTRAQAGELALHVMKLKAQQELAALPPPGKVYAVWNAFEPYRKLTPAKTPRAISVLRRGDIHQPGDPAAPGALSCVAGLKSRFDLADPNDEGARRAALARWVADPGNVLTWRSIVNRVWQYHFGRGIVDTPGDFGRMGAEPTHPELLDWLAVWFRDDAGGSLKKLHRLMVTSAAYTQSAADNPAYSRQDAGNRYLWRANRTRLEAECVRDAVLAVSGKLDLTAGGPPVDQFHYEDPNAEVTPIVDFARFDVDSPASFRRGIYRRVFRTMPDPLMDSLDCPDPSTLTASRNVSVTALQALAMMNNAFMVRQSEHLARRVARAHPGDPAAQIGAAFELALGRPPGAQESQALVEFAKKHGTPNACRVIFNCNEFVFVN